MKTGNMVCELCGKEGDELFRIDVEGTEMNACAKCSKFGKVVGHKSAEVERKKTEDEEKRRESIPEKPEIVEKIVEGFSAKIRNRREELNLKQEDFAKMISVKDSLLHKLETGEFTPPIELARKIERILKIKIVEEVEETHVHYSEKKGGNSMTIGDLVKIKEK
ncbi:MAG: multiprotein bridging factor aMBF1 [Candidatus Woesearchaeota archaeon]|nr:multiprotein bridging factor aMBF1 [Candidatus Woesearchaeota archaeon]